MKEVTITEDNIKNLVNTFYTKVRKDNLLSPVFENAIGNDAASWQPHLQKMYNFWSSIMLSTGRYSGNPLKKHKDLPSFDISLFDRWLAIFIETVNELYDEEIAVIYIEKANRIAESLKLGLYYKPEFPIK